MSEKLSLLHVKNLSKSFQSPSKKILFSGVNLSIYPGESIAIIGPSGCGKTTLLHILATLEKASSGSLHFSNKPFSSYSPYFLRNQKMGFIFQNFNLIESLSILDNVLMPAKIAGNAKQAKQKALTLLSALNLAQDATGSVSHLSGGEKQRVAMARALINDPALILADEPTGNLDEETSQSIFSMLIDQTRCHNKSLLLVTHSHSLALLCDKIYTLNIDGLTPVKKEDL
ncbi:ABC transporter ATP-binding protein [Candidatus Aerophobetes bacterium]|uniref:ABC transporter ATP-binding protein n=1 Tax=Aerophobetes bacterium TaxID=2030807 RepID=A0A2A4X880_UNCAE|nr:MAG: ABC transporter ATP-binding protein [Candidatus Aerophobetes bacterium]